MAIGLQLPLRFMELSANQPLRRERNLMINYHLIFPTMIDIFFQNFLRCYYLKVFDHTSECHSSSFRKTELGRYLHIPAKCV